MKKSGRSPRIDRLDLGILAALHVDARMSKVQIGAAVGLSPSRCYERLKRLEQAGIIRGYHADIDLVRLVSSVQFLVPVKLLNYTSVRAQHFEKSLLKIPEVIACKSVLGTVDYMLTIAAACVFRLMPATDSAAWQPPIPRHAGRVFRGMAATSLRGSPIRV